MPFAAAAPAAAALTPPATPWHDKPMTVSQLCTSSTIVCCVSRYSCCCVSQYSCCCLRYPGRASCRTRVSERQAGRKRRAEAADLDDFEPGGRRLHRRTAPPPRTASGRDRRISGRRGDGVSRLVPAFIAVGALCCLSKCVESPQLVPPSHHGLKWIQKMRWVG